MLGILSLLVSLAALLVEWRGQRASEIDRLSLTCEEGIREIGKSVALRHFAGRRLVAVPLQCDAFNAGQRRLSIVNYDVRLVDDTGQQAGFYSGLRGNLIDGQARVIETPFELDPGQARRIYFVIGLIADTAATRVLAENFNRDTIYSGRSVAIALARHGRSLIGRPVKLTMGENDTSAIAFELDVRRPRANPVRVEVSLETPLRSRAAVVIRASSAWTDW